MLRQRPRATLFPVTAYIRSNNPIGQTGAGLLKSGDYIVVDKDGYISLTADGLHIAKKIYERHTVLTDFLVRLGVNPEIAAEDACKIEHDISDESFAAIKSHFPKN